MRVGIVGAGFMGTTHARSWAETGAQIAGFLAEPPESARKIAGQYRTKVYASLDALLDGVDVVDICAPTYLHHAIARQAAQAGKHILCEKPLARTVDEAREMVATCKQAGVKLMAGHVVRFAPEYSRARALVASGEIGTPAVIRLSRCTYRPQKSTANWYLDFEKSGGMLLDLMIHDFDYARWVAGEVTSVYAKSVGSAHPEQGLDYALVILRHEGETISHIEGAWAYPPPYFRTRLEIAGAAGWVEVDSDKTTPINVHLKGKPGAAEIPARRRSLRESIYTTQIKAFYTALVSGAEPPVSGRDGLAAVQIAAAAIQSAREGVPVFLERLPEVSG